MAICKFFQQGHCRKGSNCDFEHIKEGKGAIFGGREGGDTTKDRNPKDRNSEPRPWDNNQNNSPPRRKSKRQANKLNPTTDHSHVSKLHGQAHGQASHKPEPASTQKKKKNRNRKNKNDSASQSHLNTANSYTKLPIYRPPPPQPQPNSQPGIKDYVDMVMTDLSTRPVLWHFSSYGLSLNPIQSLPFPHLGTLELSPEELRLQVYAEAAATGGRIDNYVKVVEEIRRKAEETTKKLIPELERVVTEALRVNNIPVGEQVSVRQYQETLKQTLQQRINGQNHGTNQAYGTLIDQGYGTATGQAYNPSAPTAPIATVPQHEPLFQHPTLPYQIHPPQQHQSNDIIPDDSFAFGMIPEIPPEL